jgi:hypothetical protein
MRDLQVMICLLVQEWWGVTDDLKEIAVDISKRSYRALIPDLYKGKVGVEVEEAKHVRAGMRWLSALLLCPAPMWSASTMLPIIITLSDWSAPWSGQVCMFKLNSCCELT